MKTFLAEAHPAKETIGLTGTPEQVAARAAKAYRVYLQEGRRRAGLPASIHSAPVYLMDPRAASTGSSRYGLPPEEIAGRSRTRWKAKPLGPFARDAVAATGRLVLS